MKAITLHQPWATLIACGIKTIETRSWPTPYRGPLAIHAGKHPFNARHYDRDFVDQVREDLEAAGISIDELPYGAIVATCILDDCFATTSDAWLNGGLRLPDIDYGDWDPGRYGWVLRDIQPVDPPVPARGYQGLWDWDEVQP